MGEFYIAEGGTAPNKASAIGPITDISKCMSVSTHNDIGTIFSDGDIIQITNYHGIVRGVLRPRTGGSSNSNLITYQGYPLDSTVPIICGTDIFLNANFVKSGGYTNLYEIVVAFELNAIRPNNTRIAVWDNGVRLAQAASLAACNSTPGSFFPSSNTVSPATVYVHPSDSSSVISNGRVYEISVRRSCFDSETFGAEHLYIKDLVTRRPSGQEGSMYLYNRNIIENCEANEGNYHNIQIRGGCELSRVTTTDQYFLGAAVIPFVLYEANPSHTYITKLHRCEANVTSDPLSIVETVTGFYAHTDGVGVFNQLQLTYCSAIGIDSGFSARNVALMTLSNCEDSGIVRGSGNDAGITVRVPTMIRNHKSARKNFGSRGVNILSDGVTCSVYNSEFTFENNFDGRALNVDGVGVTAEMIHCNVHGGCGISINVVKSGAIITSKNNNFKNVYKHYVLLTDTVIDSDYNNFIPTIVTFNINGVSKSLAVFKSETGQDSHSLSVDPKYISTDNRNLQSDSTCINAGVYISSASTDAQGKPRSNPPDIGAFERLTSGGFSSASLAAAGRVKYSLLANPIRWPSAPEIIAVTGVDNAVYNADGTGKTFATQALALAAMATLADDTYLFAGTKSAALYSVDMSAKAARIKKIVAD